ncbi:hypothetical protein SAMN04487906_2431 [Zhouia amylolytica]|uniref:CBU-0592-like domain-containing protein n=1 Tax=Zhouia amylolytica TaxID=376730 RepID=A0A1I6UF23_9FLAO|nr:hypothetical protein [Zhouia amylolytica]MCQ0112428.1 hypothetical protein [Zhouia amylolytica]SFT00066.1 hypothetical protein SAMN04487906_2431 [Zhouia amylolytica]
MNIYEIIGWIGSFFYLVAYVLLSFNKIRPDRLPYQVMNVLGGLCLVICAYDTKDRPNFFTNLVWMIIGFMAILMILKKKKRS